MGLSWSNLHSTSLDLFRNAFFFQPAIFEIHREDPKAVELLKRGANSPRKCSYCSKPKIWYEKKPETLKAALSVDME